MQFGILVASLITKHDFITDPYNRVVNLLLANFMDFGILIGLPCKYLFLHHCLSLCLKPFQNKNWTIYCLSFYPYVAYWDCWYWFNSNYLKVHPWYCFLLLSKLLFCLDIGTSVDLCICLIVHQAQTSLVCRRRMYWKKTSYKKLTLDYCIPILITIEFIGCIELF